ncbi:MAG: hypothetical protein ACYC5O_14275 [Anaerolineae bacterium]
MTLHRRRVVALSALVVVALLTLPVISLAQGDDLQSAVADAYVRDDEIVLINRNDGHIVIRDYAAGANMASLAGKYDSWGGPYYDVAAGDFNGDGTREIVAIGGATVGNPGSVMHTFDPVKAPTESTLPSVARNVSPYVYNMVGTGDIDGDARDEIIAVRTHSDPTNSTISAMIECWEFTTTWVMRWSKASSGGFYDMAIGDMDNDDKADIGFVRVGNKVLVIDGENPNTDLFDLTFSGPLQEWNRLEIADVNGDNSEDLTLLRPQQSVSGNFPATVLSIHPTGVNTYTDIYGWGFGTVPGDLNVGDTNGDGKNEIAVTRVSNFAKYHILNPRITTNNATEAEVWIGDSLWATNFELGDTNGDGIDQVLLMHKDGTLIRLYAHRPGQAEFDDDASGGPYWSNFVAANLDGSGVVTGPTMVVPSSVTLFYVGGTTASQATIKVGNAGSDSFTWTLTESTDWLTTSVTTGTANDTVTLSINTAALPAGNVSATVNVVGTGSTTVTNGNQNITVKLVQVPALLSRFLPLYLG